MHECSKGHPQRGPLDTLPNGTCRHCDRDAQAKYKARRRRAMQLYQELERNGIDPMNTDASQLALAAKLLANITNLSEAQAQFAIEGQSPAEVMQLVNGLMTKLGMVTA